MEEISEEALDWMLLMIEELLARTELMPEETAEAAEDAEPAAVDVCAVATEAKATTATVEKRILIVVGFMG